MLGGESIQTKTAEKDLRVMVNKTLNSTNHVKYVIAKAKKKIFFFKISKCLTSLMYANQVESLQVHAASDSFIRKPCMVSLKNGHENN